MVLAVAAGIVACEVKEEEKKKEAYSSDVTKNIDTVTNGFVPDSLKQDSTSLALADDDGVCGSLDFFACQPKLLKLYMKMAQDTVKLVNNLAPKLDEYVSTKGDNTSGSDDITDAKEAGDLDKISYSKVSATEYKAVMRAKDKGDVMLLSVKKDGDVVKYGFDFMMENTKDYESKQMKKFRGEVTFTDSDTYSVSFQLGDVDCNPNDVGGPDFIAINVERDGDLWKGKSMMRSPRLLQDPKSCNTEPTDATKFFTYTDFVANKEKVTSSLYLAKHTLSAISSMSSFATESYCTHFPCHTGGKLTTDGPVVASTYQIPYCANTSNDTVGWNGACTDLPTSDYTAESNWLLPATIDTKITELKAYTIPNVTE